MFRAVVQRETAASFGSATFCIVLWAVGGVQAQTTERVSVSSSEVQDNTGFSDAAYITPDGRFVVFYSTADNLVPGDTGDGDVFIRDRWLGTTSLVSVPDPGTGNTSASGYLGRPGVRYCSDDGRHVVFISASNTLVNNDTNGDPPYHIDGTDAFVRDRDLDGDGIFDEPGVGNTKTVRVSVKTNGNQYTEFFVGVDTYGGGISNPSISATGQYVVFESQRDNLTTGNDDGTIGSNIYWHDRDNDGLGAWDQIGPVCIIILQQGCITAEGSVTELVSKVRCCSGQQFDSYCEDSAIAGNGRYVAFATESQWLDYDLVADSDSNHRTDVYVRDMFGDGKSMRVSVDSAENQNTDLGSNNPSIDHSGRYIAFLSASSQLLASGADGNGTTDVFVRDRAATVGGEHIFSSGSTFRASMGIAFLNSATELSSPSSDAAISANGRYVAFANADPTVVCGLFGCGFDTNGKKDIFVRDTQAGVEWTRFISITASGNNANNDSIMPSVANNGQTVAFVSTASDMMTPDANGGSKDVYARVAPAIFMNAYLFYNNSVWQNVIVPDKAPLLPGAGPATFENVSSHSRGLNGIYIDVFGLSAPLGVSDFSFRVGNNGNFGSWAAAVNPSSITVVPGGGEDGSDRVKLVWADNAIPNKNWLQVTLKATANTGLGQDVVFYFGSLIGETGWNSFSPPTRWVVNSTDWNEAYNHRSPGPGTNRPIDDAFDIDRNANTNSTDWNTYIYNVRGLGPTDGLNVISP